MKKHILIVDSILIILFVLIIISKFIDFSFMKILQFSFFIFIFNYVNQHWKIIFYSLKRILKSS